MDHKTKFPQADPKTVVTRQLIVSAIALGILGLGAWSLLGQKAPYHPDGAYTDDVTRSGASDLIGGARTD